MVIVNELYMNRIFYILVILFCVFLAFYLLPQIEGYRGGRSHGSGHVVSSGTNNTSHNSSLTPLYYILGTAAILIFATVLFCYSMKQPPKKPPQVQP